MHELANISERRQERLINPSYSDLPAFLVNDGGINSGFMIAHCTSAALGKPHPKEVGGASCVVGANYHAKSALRVLFKLQCRRTKC